jgi:hypothetical protein
MICRENCKETAACEVCGCCAEHCPGHMGIRRSLRLRMPETTLEKIGLGDTGQLKISLKEQQEQGA